MVTGLSPDNEQFLNDAVATGLFSTREQALNQAVQALREKTAEAPARNVRKLSPEEWIRDLREWSDSHPPVTHFVDDSRDSIYEGRGE